MSKVGDIINQALKVWDERGWTCGSLKNAGGSVCALGALGEVIYNDAREMAKPGADLTPLYEVAKVITRYIPKDDALDAYARPGEHPDFKHLRAIANTNDRRGYEVIREAFEKAALDEGITL